MKVLAIIIILVLLPPVLISQDATNISNLPNTSSNHNWILAYGSRVMIVWREEGGYTGYDKNIYYSVFNGKSWSRPTRTYNTGPVTKNPHICRGPGGVVHLIYADGAARGREIYYQAYINGKWSSPQVKIFSSPVNSNWPRIGVSPDNTLQVTWTSETAGSDNLHYVLRNNWKNPGALWNGRGTIVSDNVIWSGEEADYATHNDIYVRGNKTYAVWQQGNHLKMHIQFSEKENNNKWSKQVVISIPGKMATWPGVCVDSTGNVHAIWSGLGGRVWGASRIRGTWNYPSQINNTGRHSRGFLAIDVDGLDRIHGVYIIDTHVYYNSANSNGNWGEHVQVSSGNNDTLPSISADDYGYVHISWSTGGENNPADIMYKRLKIGEAVPIPDTEAPVAIFSYSPSVGRKPLKVNFNAGGSYDPDGSVVSYAWNFGDGASGTGKIITHTYNKSGRYTVSLTVTDNDGFTDSVTGRVDVTDPPVAKFSFSPTFGVLPLNVQFDASKSYDPDGKIDKYSWIFGDGANGSGKKATHTYTESGKYTIILEVVDDFGVSGTASGKVTVLRVYSPLDVRWEFRENRNLFSREYLNEVKWKANPQNAANSIAIVIYNIYRREKGKNDVYITPLKTIKKTDSQEFIWMDRNLAANDKDKWEYTVTGVDVDGNESEVSGRAADIVKFKYDTKSIKVKKR